MGSLRTSCSETDVSEFFFNGVAIARNMGRDQRLQDTLVPAQREIVLHIGPTCETNG